MTHADLHWHTNASDGTYSPLELVNQSTSCGLSAIAVTDHDTTQAIGPVGEIARPLGLEVLPGIELSAEHQDQEVHILGYLIDPGNHALTEKLAALRKNRVERMYKIIEKLKAAGQDLSPQSVLEIAGSAPVGRLHIARAMVKEGRVSCVFEAFHKYIGDKGPAYYLGFKFSVSEAIGLIREAGGIPVLAHPYTVNNDELILEFINHGIMGLEVYYPEHSQSMINFYLGIVEKHGLLATGGSDCHGDAKPDVRVGSIKVPYAVVERLKATKERLR